MNLCIYRPHYNILAHLCEHFIPKQPIFFSHTVLSMIIGMWAVGERKSILQEILMTSCCGHLTNEGDKNKANAPGNGYISPLESYLL